MRVVDRAVVPAQVDRVRIDLRVLGCPHVGHEDRAPGPAHRLLVGVRGGAARPEVLALVDAGRRMAGRRLREAHEGELLGVPDVDHVDARLGRRIARAPAERARVPGQEDQLAVLVDIHVLVLPHVVERPLRGACDPLPGFASSTNGSSTPSPSQSSSFGCSGFVMSKDFSPNRPGDEHHVLPLGVAVGDEVDRDRLRQRLPVARGRGQVGRKRPVGVPGVTHRVDAAENLDVLHRPCRGRRDLPAPVSILHRRSRCARRRGRQSADGQNAQQNQGHSSHENPPSLPA